MATESNNRNKRIGLWVLVTTSLLALVIWAFLATPETAMARKPLGPDSVVLGNAGFAEDGGFGAEIDMPFGLAVEVAQSNYRTQFGTGNVVVTLSDGTVLDQKPFLIRLTNDATGERYLAFRITLQGGHNKKDRYSTLPEDIPFPETKEDPGDGSPWLEEVTPNSVDENLDMLPGAHVILHLHVSGVPLINMTGPDAGEVIGTISIGDIEFTFPE